MASDNEASCESDPNFAVICAFLEKFGGTCGLNNIDFLDLQEMLENTQEVSQELIELHIKLLRKARKSVSSERWERAIIKLCHGFCSQDAWEIERFGYKKARISSKLRILKELLEMQFDFNAKFKNDINKMSAEELRTQPLGRDRMGNIYWFQTDESCQIRVYKEDPDEETWSLVAKDKEGLIALISQLTSSDTVKIGTESITNEDSNSLVEKPIIDTGQQDSNSSTQQSKSSLEETDEMGPMDSTNDNEVKEEGEGEEETQPQPEPEEKIEPLTAETKIIEQPKENCEESNSNISENYVTQEPADSVLNLSNKPPPAEVENTLDLSTPRKGDDNSGIDLSINKTKFKPTGSETRSECIGIRNKYMRPEIADVNTRIPLNVPAFGNPVFPLRKAIHSAGFDTMDVQNCLKRPLEEEIEEPSDLNRGHSNRPSLLSNKKRKTYSDDEEDDSESVVTESADPTKEDNEYVSEAIEEPVMYVHGQGNGHDCETGNESKQENDSNEQSSSNDKSDILNSINADLASPSKYQYKLGTIIDVKTDKLSNMKSSVKNSRWDIGKPELDPKNDDSFKTALQEQTNTNQSEEKSESNEPKKMTFFFGPSSRQFTPSTLKVLPTFTMSFGQKSLEQESPETSNPDYLVSSINIKDNVDDKVPIKNSADSEPIPDVSSETDPSDNVPEKMLTQDGDCDTKNKNMVTELSQESCSAEADDTSSDEVIASSDKEEENTKLDDFQEIKKGMTSEIASQFQIDSEQSNEEDNNSSPAVAEDNFECSIQQSVDTRTPENIRQPENTDSISIDTMRENQNNIQQVTEEIMFEQNSEAKHDDSISVETIRENQNYIQRVTEESISEQNFEAKDAIKCDITTVGGKGKSETKSSELSVTETSSSIVEYSDSETEDIEMEQHIKESVSDSKLEDQNSGVEFSNLSLESKHEITEIKVDSLEESLAKLHGEDNSFAKESGNVVETDETAREMEFCSVFDLNKEDGRPKDVLNETTTINNTKTSSESNNEQCKSVVENVSENKDSGNTIVEETRISENVKNEPFTDEKLAEFKKRNCILIKSEYCQEGFSSRHEIANQSTTNDSSTSIITQIENEMTKMGELQKNAQELEQSVEEITENSHKQLERNDPEIGQIEKLEQHEKSLEENASNVEITKEAASTINENQESQEAPPVEMDKETTNKENKIVTETICENSQESDDLPVSEVPEERKIILETALSSETTPENNNVDIHKGIVAIEESSFTVVRNECMNEKKLSEEKDVNDENLETSTDNINVNETKSIVIEDIPIIQEDFEANSNKMYKNNDTIEISTSKMDIESNDSKSKKLNFEIKKADTENSECENQGSVHKNKHQGEGNVIKGNLLIDSVLETKQIIFDTTDKISEVENIEKTAQVCETDNKEKVSVEKETTLLDEIQPEIKQVLFIEEHEKSVEEVHAEVSALCKGDSENKVVEKTIEVSNKTVSCFEQSRVVLNSDLKQNEIEDEDNTENNKIVSATTELKVLDENQLECRKKSLLEDTLENIKQTKVVQDINSVSETTVSTEKELVVLDEKQESLEMVKTKLPTQERKTIELVTPDGATVDDKIVYLEKEKTPDKNSSSFSTTKAKSPVEEIKTSEVIEKIDQNKKSDTNQSEKSHIELLEKCHGVSDDSKDIDPNKKTDESKNKDTVAPIESQKESNSCTSVEKDETCITEKTEILVIEEAETSKHLEGIEAKDTAKIDQNKNKTEDVLVENEAEDTSAAEKSEEVIKKVTNISNFDKLQSLEKTEKSQECFKVQDLIEQNVVMVQNSTKVTDEDETKKQKSCLESEVDEQHNDLAAEDKTEVTIVNAEDKKSGEKIALTSEGNKTDESLVTLADKIELEDENKIKLKIDEPVGDVDDKTIQAENCIENIAECPANVDSMEIFSGTLKKIPELIPNEEEIDPLGDVVEKTGDEVPMERPKGIKIVSLDKLIDNTPKQSDIVEFQELSDSDNQFDSNDLVKPANEGLMLQIQDVRTITDDEEEFEQYKKSPAKGKNKLEARGNLRRSARTNRSASIIEIDSDEEASPKKIRTQGRGGNRQNYKAAKPEIKVAERQKTMDSLSKMRDITVHSISKVNMPKLPPSITVTKTRPLVEDIIEIESDDSTDSLIKVPNLLVPKSLGMEIRITRGEQKQMAIKEEEEEEKEVTITRMSAAKKSTQQHQQKLRKKSSELEVDPLAVENHALPKYFQGNKDVVIQKVDKVEIVPKEKISVNVIEKRMPGRRTRNSKGSLEDDNMVLSPKTVKSIDIIDHNQVFNRIPITARSKSDESRSSTETADSIINVTGSEEIAVKRRRGRPKKGIPNDNIDKSLGNENIDSPSSKTEKVDSKEDCDADQGNKIETGESDSTKNVRSLRHKVIELPVVTKKNRKSAGHSNESDISKENTVLDSTLPKENEVIAVEEDTKADENDENKSKDKSNYSPKHLRYRRVVEVTPPVKKTKSVKQNESKKPDNSANAPENVDKQNLPSIENIEKDEKSAPVTLDITEKGDDLVSDSAIESENKIEDGDTNVVVKGISKRKRRGRPRKRVVRVITKSAPVTKEESTETLKPEELLVESEKSTEQLQVDTLHKDSAQTTDVKDLTQTTDVKDSAQTTDVKDSAPSTDVKDSAQTTDTALKNTESCSSTGEKIENVAETDPLACLEEEIKVVPQNDENQKEQPLTLATFKLDVSDSPTSNVIGVKRKRDKRSTESEDVEADETVGKRPKMRGKRAVDLNLRHSIEEKKMLEISSSDDDNRCDISSPPYLVSEDEGNKTEADDDKKMPLLRKEESDNPALSENSHADVNKTPPVKSTAPRKKKKTLLGLEVPSDFNHEEFQQTTGVRQSRRIAQLKIKEEAERRKLEEMAMADIAAKMEKQKKSKKDEDKDYKSTEKRKRHKIAPTDEETTVENEVDDKKKRKKRKKHKDPRKIFDESNPWRSSSESSTSNEEDEEDEIAYYSDDDLQLFKSDHEFSPESDLEENGEVQPMKRARTARKESDVEEVDDCACQKCGQSDHPEWILLCDRCDNGWHCSCLRPALLVIPEGDWFCPPCQHNSLITNLQNTLDDYSQRLKRRDLEERRKERLAYVGISLNNVLPPSKESAENTKHKSRHNFEKVDNNEEEDESDDDDGDGDNDNDNDEEEVPGDEEEEESESDESESESETESSSSSSESEPVYQLRERRQAHSYRFTDYDNLINSAIQDEMEAVKGAGNQGRGKDISTIVNAEKEEEAARLKAESERLQSQIPTDLSQSGVIQEQEQEQQEELPPVVPVDTKARPLENEDSDDEPIRPVKKKHIGRKKHKKLNSLDVSSEDDTESDEDFKGSSSSNEDEEDIDEEDLASESSEDSGRRRYKNSGPIRRSTRARIARYDREFINDDSDDDAPRRKKVRQFWDDEDSESEESDRSWGRRKRRARQPRRKSTSSVNKKSRVKKKKKKTPEDSDPEVFKQRKPKIKFGNVNDDEEEIGRRTRGKKINYLEALGSDSDDDVSKRPVPKPLPSDEEYIANEEELKSTNTGEQKVTGSYSQNVPQLLPPMNLQTIPPPPYTGNYMANKPLESGTLPLISPQESALLAEFGSQDMDEEPNPIEVMNKNLEEMNESEMEKMMEEEEYATKQLQLVALQIEKEKKRKEREAKKLEMLAQQEQKGLKKNVSGDLLPEAQVLPSLMMSSADLHNNAELSEPPGVSLPLFGEINPDVNLENSPKKRRGRGKGKKTIAAEQAAAAAAAEQAAAAAAAAACREKLLNSDPKVITGGLGNVDSSNSSTASPAPDSPLHGKLGIAAPPQPFSQSQPTPSVITRMLQSQPGQSNYPKYFAGLQTEQPGTVYPPAISVTTGIPVITNQFIAGVQRPPVSSPYHQTPSTVGHYPVVRSGPPPHQLRSPAPQNIPQHLYQSQGGDRNSPTIASPASAGSPLSNKNEPPPPPYPRPQLVRFPPVSGSTPPIALTQAQRHQQLPMIPPPHLQQPRPTNMPPYHHTVPPPNYYGSYPTAAPPTLSTSEEALPPTVYQNSPYSEQFSGDGQPSENSNSKSFDEEAGGGEFGGLVSYFSSQREDDLDT